MELSKDTHKDIYISFNHNSTHCCFGTSIGFYIFQINPFNKILSRKIDGGVSIIKMLHESNIIIFVGAQDSGLYPNNKLIIWDDQKRDVLGEISYNSKILNICITKNNIITLCENKIYIYNFETLTLIKSINTKSISNLISIGLEESDYLIYPGEDIGTVTVVKLNSDYCNNIKAHNHKIEHLTLSNDGKYFASASEKGTLIRIFNIETAKQVHEVRRGIDPSKIVDIKLSDDNSTLLVSSIKGTIHLYKTNIDSSLEETNKRLKGYGVGTLASLIPNIVRPNYIDSEWGFCQIYISNVLSKSVIDKKNQKIYTFGNDGQFYEINYTNSKDPKIERVIKYISDESDPFSKRSTTIK
tara:strand:- start:268 stop:1335 length:1068 start_codon:yes stop_codon:yes gene_type:complete